LSVRNTKILQSFSSNKPSNIRPFTFKNYVYFGVPGMLYIAVIAVGN